VFFKIFLLIICTTTVELFLLIEIGYAIGVFWTVAVIVATAAAGAALLRRQGLKVHREITASLARAELPTDHLIDGLLILLGGALMLTPGVVTDVTGLLLMLPPLRKVLRAPLKNYFKKKLTTGGFHMHTNFKGFSNPDNSKDFTDFTDYRKMDGEEEE